MELHGAIACSCRPAQQQGVDGAVLELLIPVNDLHSMLVGSDITAITDRRKVAVRHDGRCCRGPAQS